MLVKLVDHAIVHHTAAVDEITQRYKLSSSKIEVIPHGHYRNIYESAINSFILDGNTLLIAGKALEDRYEQMLKKQASVTKNIILRNTFVEDERIHLYFSAADVVVLPFERILTSGSLILAMSYSKPVIAPRLGSIPETLGDADWLLYNTKEERGLLHAIKDSTQVDLDALGRLVNEACDRLDWNAIAQKTFQVYQNG